METKRSCIASMRIVHSVVVAAGLGIALLQTAGAAGAPAVVVQINGAPQVERSGNTQALQPGASLDRGDVVITDGQSKARIVLADDSVLTVGPKSRITIESIEVEPKGRIGRLQVIAGSFKIAISKLLSGTTDYEIRTPTAVVGVRGTIVWGDTELDSVCALDGKVEVRSIRGGAQAEITAGQCVQRMGLGSPVPVKPSPAELETYLKAVTLD